MELKYGWYSWSKAVEDLLIVPNGIEIAKLSHIKPTANRLLIVPNGIEIQVGRGLRPSEGTVNRTKWN